MPDLHPPEEGSGTLRIAVLCYTRHYFHGVLMKYECTLSGYYIARSTLGAWRRGDGTI